MSDGTTRGIVGFELGLPVEWHVVPGDLADVGAWSHATASELVRGAVAQGLVGAQAADTTDVLAEQLSDVAAVVRDADISSMQTAVLVRRPESGVVDAMVTLVAQQGLGVEQFTASLSHGVETTERYGVVHAGEITGTGDAGRLVGVHLLLGSAADAGLGADLEVLEERVVLGVFPPASRDMVEVTAIARSVGTFEDMPQAMVDLMAGLVVETEPLS
ncbi:hypothetical protein LEP48_17220 [Isoptericola sp. NEAU-Y5]|uniref:Uncharacterized protein n=1 Tax=Isoptericola luteus TaxID=2879484 RepID=A0ABS7ZJA8_9MICO|nr:hypothetical protein [Isoptericola sp. NEAU-Y5]MCA5895073.1 hypothetical protein [Isoptericola sp. NEAU-Y5]